MSYIWMTWEKNYARFRRSKTARFSAGENVYGYCTKPVGELKLNRKGQAKYEGMVHKIAPEEAATVKLIFKEFSEGKSAHKIAIQFNEEKNTD